MNTGETADLMVRESIQITESSIKLAAAGAKNLTALLLAAAQDNQKIKGKTGLQRLLKEGKELKVFRLKKENLAVFHSEAKKYGVLYTAIADKKDDNNLCDLMAKAEDVSKVNHILERLGYPAPTKESPSKKAEARAPYGKNFAELGNGANVSGQKTISDETKARPSVKARINALKQTAGSTRAQNYERTYPTR